MNNQFNKILKTLFALEFVLILIIIILTLVENIGNQKIPTAYVVKEIPKNSSTEKTDFKTITKAVCEEKSEHVFCRDVLFIECNGNEYAVDDFENFTKCNGIKLNLADSTVTGHAILSKNWVDPRKD